jgi:lipid A 4'-phosphatase
MPTTAASSNGAELATVSATAGSAVLTRWSAKSRAFCQRLRHCPPLLVPLAILIIATLVLCLHGTETGISALFHDGGKTWTLKNTAPWTAIYDFGAVPGLAVGISGLVVAIVSLCVPALRSWRRIKIGFFLALSLAIGPGLIVNSVLKPKWGRPRPNQLAMFGGSAEYSPAWIPGGEVTGKSFPSGHASMGFFLMVPAFLLYRRNRRWAIVLFGAGLAAGGVVGLARIVQGGHFASDVLWSAACVYFSAFLLYLLFRFDVAAESKAQRDGETETVLRLPDAASQDDYREAA